MATVNSGAAASHATGGSAATLNAEQSMKQQKITSYEYFLNEVLRTDLRSTLERRGHLQNKISEYTQQKTILEKLTSSQELSTNIRTKVDLGCDFYIDTLVPNLEKVVMNLGLGTWVEVTPEEAISICDREIEHLNKAMELISKQELKLKAHINLVINGLREIQYLGPA